MQYKKIDARLQAINKPLLRHLLRFSNEKLFRNDFIFKSTNIVDYWHTLNLLKLMLKFNLWWLSYMLPVTRVRAARQAKDDMSTSIWWRDWQNSRIECNQSPRLRWHWPLLRTTPLQNVILESISLVLEKTRYVNIYLLQHSTDTYLKYFNVLSEYYNNFFFF